MILGYIVLFIGKPQWFVRLSEQTFNIRLKRIDTRSRANPRRMKVFSNM